MLTGDGELRRGVQEAGHPHMTNTSPDAGRSILASVPGLRLGRAVPSAPNSLGEPQELQGHQAI